MKSIKVGIADSHAWNTESVCRSLIGVPCSVTSLTFAISAAKSHVGSSWCCPGRAGSRSVREDSQHNNIRAAE